MTHTKNIKLFTMLLPKIVIKNYQWEKNDDTRFVIYLELSNIYTDTYP